MASTEKLLDGFKRFHQNYFNDDSRLYDSMKNGQPAKTLMIACCDSRVDPAIITDCDPGDLFTIRNVANLVPPSDCDGHHHGTSAALEFAINNLEVENIIVMGHANCGGIKALWDGEAMSSQFIQPWMAIAQAAKDKVISDYPNASEAEKIKACEQESILVSLENLLEFSCVKERLEKGVLSLHGWYFDIPLGEIYSYNTESNTFELATIEAS